MPSNHFEIGMSNTAAACHECILIVNVINKGWGRILREFISHFFGDFVEGVCKFSVFSSHTMEGRVGLLASPSL